MMKCPICKRSLPALAADRRFGPFCSERCRLADLGSWLDGGYRIAVPLADADLDEGLPTEGGAFTGANGKTTN
jgi:endogenous inhibitor of DNA gyrase (YacG/DUF329 family)